jgi:hypothetical protein
MLSRRQSGGGGQEVKGALYIGALSGGQSRLLGGVSARTYRVAEAGGVGLGAVLPGVALSICS